MAQIGDGLRREPEETHHDDYGARSAEEEKRTELCRPIISTLTEGPRLGGVAKVLRPTMLMPD